MSIVYLGFILPEDTGSVLIRTEYNLIKDELEAFKVLKF